MERKNSTFCVQSIDIGPAIDKTVYEVVFEYVDGNTPVIEVGFELTNELISEESETETEDEPESETKKQEEQPKETPSQSTPTGTTTTSDGKGYTTSAPKTGDNTPLFALLGVLVASADCIGWILFKERSKK